MKGTVKVVAKGRAIPSAKANKKAAKKEYAKAAKRLIKDAKFAGPPGNEVRLGNDRVGRRSSASSPRRSRSRSGTTVTFSMPAKTTETHTFSFGPADYLDEHRGRVVRARPGRAGALVFDPLITRSRATSPALPADDGTSHGNGFFSTGRPRPRRGDAVAGRARR